MRFAIHRALRPAPAALLAVTVLLSGVGAAAAAPAAAAPTRAKSPDVPTKSDLAALRAQADRAAATLAAGTRALEQVQQQAQSLTRRAAKASKRAEILHAQLAVLRQQVGAVAAAAYRNPLGSDSMLGTPSTVGDDSLQAMGYLNVVAARRSQVLRETATTRVRAEQSAREATALATQASAASADAARRVSALQREATAIGAALTKAVAAYEAEQERLRVAAAARAAARARADRLARLATRGNGRCSGGGREWGGYPNGFIPESALTALAYAPGHRLRCDAAAGFNKMTAAYAADHGGAHLCVTDSYRSYSEQQRLYREKPSLAAVPGTSNHGWALAVDLCGGAQRAGSDVDNWLHANAGRFGWRHPDWAEPGGSRPEPWHWEYGNIS